MRQRPCCAWRKSRNGRARLPGKGLRNDLLIRIIKSVFLLGFLGAVSGVAFLAPIATMDFFGDVTELDFIWSYALVDLQGSLPAAAIGVVVGWIATLREPRTRNSRPAAREIRAMERP
jgi:hypothetical protein